MTESHLHISIATAEPTRVKRLIGSIEEHLPNFEMSFYVLLIGNADVNELVNLEHVHVISSYTAFLPIVESRNLCQSYLQSTMLHDSDLGFVLDDDLMWSICEPEFIELINTLRKQNADMALSSMLGDAPIPKEYTQASPLLDILCSLAENDNSSAASAIHKYLNSVNYHFSNGTDDQVNQHHDYYSFVKNDFQAKHLDVSKASLERFISRLHKGKVTTRTVRQATEIKASSGRERGGATIILNPRTLQYANIAIRINGVLSRRSDMVMAKKASREGFRLFHTPPIVSHQREESFDSHTPNKVLGDILGYSLVESLEGDNYCLEKLKMISIERASKTSHIIENIIEMVNILLRYLPMKYKISSEYTHLLNDIVKEHTHTLFCINRMIGDIQNNLMDIEGAIDFIRYQAAS